MLIWEQKRFLSWSKSPIPGLAISTSGLLALADLSTTAKRTALTGTAIWLDVLVLAPGLHYQQKAEAMGTSYIGRAPEVTNLNTGSISRVTNTATIHYLQRIGKKDTRVVLDVGDTEKKNSVRPVGPRGEILRSEKPPSSAISTILYNMPPLLTLTSIGLLIGSQEWWGLAIVLALMVSRALNVWIIRQRTKDEPPPSNSPNVHENWWVTLDDNRCVCLRGLAHDLEAITTGSWMRTMTNIEGYMEAASKIIVYFVAIFSGNQSQTGDIILMVLLLGSSALLALSNAYASTYHMNGRTASPSDPGLDPNRDSAAPTLSEASYGSGSVPSDFEKDEAAKVLRTTFPFSDEVNYV
jgi:hypothetical protein